MKQNANKQPEATPEIAEAVLEASKEETLVFDIKPGATTSVVSGNDVLFYGDGALSVKVTVVKKEGKK